MEKKKSQIKKLSEIQNLNFKEAYTIGKFLFSEEIIDSHKFDFEIGLITTILRFRYETLKEFSGLLKAIEELFYKD